MNATILFYFGFLRQYCLEVILHSDFESDSFFGFSFFKNNSNMNRSGSPAQKRSGLETERILFGFFPTPI